MSNPPPARVALVMTYPYEAFLGGEDSYVAALRRYLVRRGHRVDTLISDVTRGRSNPVVALPREIGEAGSLRVRRTLRLGERRHVSPDPALLLRALSAAIGRRSKVKGEQGEGERRWLLKAIEDGGYDAVILMWEASRHAAELSRHCSKVLALKGFCTAQRLHLGKPPEVVLPEAIVAELAEARLIGMNNAAEANELRRLLPGRNVIQVGMGFAEQPALAASPDPFVLFVGANSGANRRSLEWLLCEVWPRIAAVHPQARLRVAGSVRNGWDGAVPPGVDLLGRVELLEEEYRRAQVVVAPITVGSAGVKIKVAEALSYGRPLVSTSLGVDPGDPGQFADAVDVADDPALFAEAVCRLLADAALRERRARQSAEAFAANFSGAAAYGALTEHLAL